MPVLYKNNVATVLAGPLDTGATTMSVDNGAAVPAVASPNIMYLTLVDALNTEIVKVTSHSAFSASMTIERSQDGTSDPGTTWAPGSIVENRIIAGNLASYETLEGDHAASLVTTPADADELNLLNSAGGYSKARILWAGIKATLKTYFDAVYTTLAAVIARFEAAEVSVATAATNTTDIGIVATPSILLTTTETTVTGFATAVAGVVRKCRVATGGFTLVHGVTLTLPSLANILTEANDTFEAYSTGTGWVLKNYMRASGLALVSPNLATASVLYATSAGSATSATSATNATNATYASYLNGYQYNNLPYATTAAIVSVAIIGGDWINGTIIRFTHADNTTSQIQTYGQTGGGDGGG